MYADVIVDISVEKLDKVFQYHIPAEMEDKIHPGVPVVVSFGKGNRTIDGIVTKLSDKTDYDPTKIKDIISIRTKSLSVEEKFISLAYAIQARFGGTINDALKTVMPVKNASRLLVQKDIILAVSDEEAMEVADVIRKKSPVQAKLIDELITYRKFDRSFVLDKMASASSISSLEKKGIIETVERRVLRNTVRNSFELKPPKVLNEQQQAIVDDIGAELAADIHGKYLIHGVTGSGKTEVYLDVIQKVIDRGEQVIVLIPEIALTYQTVARFMERFGKRLTVMHSKLTPAERFDQFQKAKEGMIDIMIGPRSVLFTPFDNLGLIIIDEEHENSYKSEQIPKYHAREVALMRAEMENAAVILGSATPSIESYYMAQKGELKMYRLTKRARTDIMPQVEIVDLREELKSGNKSIFSRSLAQKMERTLSEGHQVMLFINRRGYAGFISCRSCGEVIKCPHCDVSLKEHYGKRLVCHYCGYETAQVNKCPKCGSGLIGAFGTGTEKVEEAVKKLFPDKRVLRMDADTVKGKDGHQVILEEFARGSADILIGTQMIVKGHDFPNVTLVGIIAADLSLNENDFRASERTFDLLTQAAGRAGRAEFPGEVVIQTYRPDHFAITCSATEDYESFYQQEIMYRKLAGYPPAAHVYAVIFMSTDEKRVEDAISVYMKLAKEPSAAAHMSMIGPVTPTITKISDIYRKLVYFKGSNEDFSCILQEITDKCNIQYNVLKNVTVHIDYDPINSY